MADRSPSPEDTAATALVGALVLADVAGRVQVSGWLAFVGGAGIFVVLAELFSLVAVAAALIASLLLLELVGLRPLGVSKRKRARAGRFLAGFVAISVSCLAIMLALVTTVAVLPGFELTSFGAIAGTSAIAGLIYAFVEAFG